MAAKTDNFQSPDYFLVDELLTEEHKLVRDSVRNYVKKKFLPSLKIMRKGRSFPSILSNNWEILDALAQPFRWNTVAGDWIIFHMA